VTSKNILPIITFLDFLAFQKQFSEKYSRIDRLK